MPQEVFEREEKRLAKPFRYVAQADDEGLFSGHGAVFDDSHPTSSWRLPPDWTDTIKPGAFKKALAESKKSGVMPAMLLQHASNDLPIGAWLTAEEDDDGLKLSGKLATKTAKGMEVYELLKMGALSGLSIGFFATEIKLDEKLKVREILKVDLFEVSVVTIPASAAARISDVKSADPTTLKRIIEANLRDAGRSRTEAKAFVAAGFKALDLRDAGSGTAAAPQFDPSQLLAGLRALRGA